MSVTSIRVKPWLNTWRGSVFKFWWVFFVFCLGLQSAFAQAPHAEIRRIDPLVQNGQLVMDVDIDLQLSSAMREALDRGVPLAFEIAIEIGEPRWWWFDRKLVQAQLLRRISYNTLTRQWRVSTGDLGMVVPTYEEALDLVRRVRGWVVAPIDRFDLGNAYEGQVRIQLDMTQMSRALQLDASKRDWQLTSAWRTFSFQLEQEKIPEVESNAISPQTEARP